MRHARRLRPVGWLLGLLALLGAPALAGCTALNTGKEDAEVARCGDGMCGNLLQDLLGEVGWESYGYATTAGDRTTLAIPTVRQLDYTCQPVMLLDPNPDAAVASFHLIEVRDYPDAGGAPVPADQLPEAFKVPKIGPKAFNKAVKAALAAGHAALAAVCQRPK